MMFKQLRKLKAISYYGFPLGEERKQNLDQSKNRGVALLIALMTIMLMVSLVTDMIITSTVNLELATASRDRIRSEYLAKSGMNFALLMLSMSWGYDLFRAQPSTPQMIKKDLSDDGNSLWNMANKLPPFGSMTVDLLMGTKKEKKEGSESENNKENKKGDSIDINAFEFPKKSDESEDEDPFKLKGLMNEKIANEMRLFEESFSIKIMDEASKINVNQCYTGRCDDTINMLTALFSCPAEKAFLESKNLHAEQLAYRIKDFISDSQNPSPESGFNDKNAPYANHNPPYTVKSVPFDSVDELKLIEGWDDDLHAIFSPYLTVYPYPVTGSKSLATINVNTVKPELLSCLIPESRASNCAESFAQKIYKIKSDNTPVFQKDMASTLGDLACLGKDPSMSQAGSDKKIDPVSWFDQKSSVFRIVIDSTTGKQDRRLTSVIRRIMPKEKINHREQQVVKRSYQILHWKLQ